MPPQSKWRLRARAVIERVIAENPLETDYGMLERIDKAYPFGPRKNLPYRMWLLERKLAMTRISTNPLFRVCGACGAGIAKRCKDMGCDQFSQHRNVLDDAYKVLELGDPRIRELELLCCHTARHPPARLSEHEINQQLPLLAGIQ